MLKNFSLNRAKTGLIIVDVQQNLFPLVEHSCEVLQKMLFAIEGFQILKLPIIVTEQYPQGLGPTIEPIKKQLPADQSYFPKTSFSCMKENPIHEKILTSPITQWVIIGIEAHVCVLQSAKDLLASEQQVVVLNDAISSRSIYDFSTAIAEMRDMGIRVTSIETILFELVENGKDPEFKQISALIKKQQNSPLGCC
jgi:nicotinamidase-related amidase